MILKVAALCVAVAMICSAIRVQRPELATAISLSAGLAALALVTGTLADAGGWIASLRRLLATEGDLAQTVVRGAGIAIVGELGAQLCTDAGESALAGRVTLASRVAMLGLCGPMLAELAGLLGASLP